MKEKESLDQSQSNSEFPINDRKDYADFLDLAIHELDAPLRKLTVMVEKMADKYEKGDSEQARHLLDRAQAGLHQMRSGIDALYQLSKLEAEELSSNECDLNKMITQLVAELKMQNKDSVLYEKHEGLPILTGDQRQLRQLFRELLQNAIRFNEDKANVRVEITSSALTADEKSELKLPENENYFKLVIRDNGIGFAKEDSAKIFKPFVRLNGRSAYPGNGIGLAICQKIVYSHHGIIYAEPNPPGGSSILLILPQRLN